MTAPGPLSDDAAEADALEQRAEAVPEDDTDEVTGSPGTGDLDGLDDTSLDANPADVAEQQQAVPMDSDDRGDPP